MEATTEPEDKSDADTEESDVEELDEKKEK